MLEQIKIGEDEHEQIFFKCVHCGSIDDKGLHKCAHDLTGLCLSNICSKTRRDLDRFGNCSACGSHEITGRTAKYTWAEVRNSLKTEELDTSRGVNWSRISPIANIKRLAGWLSTTLRNRVPVFNRKGIKT
jgi:DNA-directed RNA polymerase subunit M/transcription elongation factor TFIIS